MYLMHKQFQAHNPHAAFTIVELLIVIVVIGVLAAITVVAYSGLQLRAETARVQSLSQQFTKKLEAFQIENGAYPASITDCPAPAAGNLCLSPGSGMSISYLLLPKGPHTIIPGGYQTNTREESYELTLFGDRRFLYSSPAEKYTATSEFMQYTDLAPIIDKYGLVKYRLSFDIKSQDISNMSAALVYFQNGGGARYGSLAVNVPVQTTFTHHEFVFTPTVQDLSLPYSILAFYGTYGTGNVLTVKNVSLKLEP